MIITSTKNDQIKYLKLLQGKSRFRMKEHCFVVEGLREMEIALSNGIEVVKLYTNPSIYDNSLAIKNEVEVVELSDQVYQHIAYRSGTEGIMGICKTPSHGLKDLEVKSNNPLILVLESPEKPGNIGAILRTADAAGIDAVIIAEPITDLYNPNTIRSSLGAIFSTKIAKGTNNEVYAFLDSKGITGYAATLQNSNNYLLENYRSPTGFIMGSEAKGLSEFWRIQPNIKAVNIPMDGQLDSLNLSVSTAVLTYEAVRQRQ